MSSGGAVQHCTRYMRKVRGIHVFYCCSSVVVSYNLVSYNLTVPLPARVFSCIGARCNTLPYLTIHLRVLTVLNFRLFAASRSLPSRLSFSFSP